MKNLAWAGIAISLILMIVAAGAMETGSLTEGQAAIRCLVYMCFIISLALIVDKLPTKILNIKNWESRPKCIKK